LRFIGGKPLFIHAEIPEVSFDSSFDSFAPLTVGRSGIALEVRTVELAKIFGCPISGDAFGQPC